MDKQIIPTKSVTITSVLKRNGFKKSYIGTGGRIAMTTYTQGFYVQAHQMDYDYRKVGQKWRKTIKRNARFFVTYNAFSTTDFSSKTAEAHNEANQTFVNMVTCLEAEGFVIESVDYKHRSILVAGTNA